jgi:hypothetical protein
MNWASRPAPLAHQVDHLESIIGEQPELDDVIRLKQELAGSGIGEAVEDVVRGGLEHDVPVDGATAEQRDQQAQEQGAAEKVVHIPAKVTFGAEDQRPNIRL